MKFFLMQTSQGNGFFQLLILVVIVAVLFWGRNYIRKSESTDIDIDEIEDLNKQLVVIIAKYKNGFLILILATVIQLIISNTFVDSIDAHTNGFTRNTNLNDYFRDQKSKIVDFQVGMLFCYFLYFIGLVKLWFASKIKYRFGN